MFWVRSDLESRKQVSFQFLGRWGVFWVRSDLESRKKVRVFNLRGVFWVRSDWNLERKLEFSILGGGGVLGKVRFGLWEEFHFWGGALEPNSRTPGCSGEFGQKFLEA